MPWRSKIGDSATRRLSEREAPEAVWVRKALAQVSALAAGGAAGAALRSLGVVLFAREVPLPVYGAVVLAQAVVFACVYVGKTGFGMWGQREVGSGQRDSAVGAAVVGQCLAVSVAVFLSALLVLWDVGGRMRLTPSEGLLVLIGGLANGISVEWVHVAKGRAKGVGLMKTVRGGVFAAVAVMGLLRPNGLTLALAIAASECLYACLTLGLIFRNAGSYGLMPSLSSVVRAMGGASRFALVNCVGIVWNADIVLLGYWWGPSAVAVYNVAGRIVDAVGGVQRAILAILSQNLFRAARHGTRAIQLEWQKSAKWSLAAGAVGIMVAVVVSMVGGPFLPSAYHGVGVLVAILAIKQMLALQAGLNASAFGALGSERRIVKSAISAACMCIVGAPVLVLKASAVGAALAMVITEAVSAGVLLWDLRCMWGSATPLLAGVDEA